jgi:hypothetical protein
MLLVEALAGGNRLGSCVAPARRRVGQRLGYAGRGLADKRWCGSGWRLRAGGNAVWPASGRCVALMTSSAPDRQRELEEPNQEPTVTGAERHQATASQYHRR